MPKAKVKPRKKTKFGMKRSAEEAGLEENPKMSKELRRAEHPDLSLGVDGENLQERPEEAIADMSYVMDGRTGSPPSPPPAVGGGNGSISIVLAGQEQSGTVMIPGDADLPPPSPGGRSASQDTVSTIGSPGASLDYGGDQSQSQSQDSAFSTFSGSQSSGGSAASTVSIQSYLLTPVDEIQLANLLRTDPTNQDTLALIRRSMANFYARNASLRDNKVVKKVLDLASNPILSYRNLRYMIGQAHGVFQNEDARDLRTLLNAADNIYVDNSFYLTVGEIREFVIANRNNGQLNNQDMEDLKHYLKAARRLKRVLYRVNELCKQNSGDDTQNSRKAELALLLSKFAEEGTAGSLSDVTTRIMNQLSNIYLNMEVQDNNQTAPVPLRKFTLLDPYASEWAGLLQFILKYVAEVINPKNISGTPKRKVDKIKHFITGPVPEVEVSGLQRNSPVAVMGIAAIFYAPVESPTSNQAELVGIKREYLAAMGVDLSVGPITALGRFFDVSRNIAGESTKVTSMWGALSGFTSMVAKYYGPAGNLLAQTAPKVGHFLGKLASLTASAGAAAASVSSAQYSIPLAVSGVLLAGEIYRRKKLPVVEEYESLANENIESYVAEKTRLLIFGIVSSLESGRAQNPEDLPPIFYDNIRNRLLAFTPFGINTQVGQELQLYVKIIEHPYIVTRALRTPPGPMSTQLSPQGEFEISTNSEFESTLKDDIPDIETLIETVGGVPGAAKGFFMDRLDLVGRCLNILATPEPAPQQPAGAVFGKIMKPYRKYMVSYTGAELPVLQTSFGKLQLQENRKGLFVDGGGRKWYIYNWGKKV